MCQSAEIRGALPNDDIKKIWNLLVRNRLLIAATTGVVAGAAIAYTFWGLPVPVSPLGLLNLL